MASLTWHWINSFKPIEICGLARSYFKTLNNRPLKCSPKILSNLWFVVSEKTLKNLKYLYFFKKMDFNSFRHNEQPVTDINFPFDNNFLFSQCEEVQFFLILVSKWISNSRWRNPKDFSFIHSTFLPRIISLMYHEWTQTHTGLFELGDNHHTYSWILLYTLYFSSNGLWKKVHLYSSY